MTGSVLDGEDLVQEALFEAYRKLDKYDDNRPLAPWLFQIAHNRCIDLLRRRGVREEVEAPQPGQIMFCRTFLRDRSLGMPSRTWLRGCPQRNAPVCC